MSRCSSDIFSLLKHNTNAVFSMSYVLNEFRELHVSDTLVITVMSPKGRLTGALYQAQLTCHQAPSCVTWRPVLPVPETSSHLLSNYRKWTVDVVPFYLLAEWCTYLLWLSNFLCIRSLARQQWCAVSGLQILKEERRGVTHAAIFVCQTSCAWASL